MQYDFEIEWVPVEEDLPLVVSPYDYLSDDVCVLTDKGNTFTGYYDQRNGMWRTSSCSNPIKEEVIAWKSL